MSDELLKQLVSEMQYANRQIKNIKSNVTFLGFLFILYFMGSVIWTVLPFLAGMAAAT